MPKNSTTLVSSGHGELISELRTIVGESSVIEDPAVMQAYCVDWTRRFGGPAVCVVRPGSTQEVAAVMQACAAVGVPVLPQGGNTGLVGGSVPAAGRSADGNLPNGESGEPSEP